MKRLLEFPMLKFAAVAVIVAGVLNSERMQQGW